MTRPAGWYPDPSAPGGQRYFDGVNWTAHQAIAPAAQAAAPTKKYRAWPWLLAIALFLALRGGAALFVAGSDLGPSNSGPKRQPVRDGQLQFVVDDVTTASVQDNPRPDREYVLAIFTVTKTSNQSQTFLVANQKLIDAGGREYGPLRMTVETADHDTTILDVKPGVELNVRMRFDVPKDAKMTALELHESASSTGATVHL